jgi:hypothetical protein
MDNRTGLDDEEKWKFLTLTGLEVQIVWLNISCVKYDIDGVQFSLNLHTN